MSHSVPRSRSRFQVRVPVQAQSTHMQVWFPRHALDRYVERAASGLEVAAAKQALEHIAALGQVTPGAPSWLWGDHGDEMHLVIGDICFPLRTVDGEPDLLVAATCMVRGWTPPHRAGRHARRPGRRRGRIHRHANSRLRNQKGSAA